MIALSTVREWLEIEDNHKKVWRGGGGTRSERKEEREEE